jgi:hypothetical protein
MASLAPHVSRVLKEASPHGFSVSTDAVVYVGSISATSSDNFLLGAEDSDIYIESITVLSESDADAHATNIWTIDVQDKGADGTGSTSLFATPPNTVTNGISALVPYTVSPDQNQLISDGQGIAITFTKGASASNLDELRVQVRYRRKA